MSDYFHKIYHKEVTWADDTEITEQQKNNIEVMKSGAIYLYTMLVDNIVRNDWIDHKGYPLKKKYYNNNTLVCSYSSETLQKRCGVGRRVYDKWIKVLKDANWIVISRGVRDGQKVYVLGTWEIINDKYTETLYKYITTKETEPNDALTAYYASDEFDMEY